MLNHTPEQRDTLIEALAKVIHEGDWSAGGSNETNGRRCGDWPWHKATAPAKSRARMKARAVLHSEVLHEIVRAEKFEAYAEGRDSIGLLLSQPLNEFGMREPIPNPYESPASYAEPATEES